MINKSEDLNGMINKFLDEISGVFAKKIPDEVNSADNSFNTSREISAQFELMLGFTKSMMSNMNEMQIGFAKTVEIIIGIINTISGRSNGGIGGLLSGLFGVIGSIFGLPFGIGSAGALGAGLSGSAISGAVSGGLINQREGLNNIVTNQPQIINQIVIKNPVTFQKAFDAEIRNRELRGGIDL